MVEHAGSGPALSWQAWLHFAMLCDLGFRIYENEDYQTDVMARLQE